MRMRTYSKTAVKIESAREREGSTGGKHLLHATLHDLHVSILSYHEKEKPQTHLRNAGVNFLLYPACLAGSITY